jgi:hypothetical protein
MSGMLTSLQVEGAELGLTPISFTPWSNSATLIIKTTHVMSICVFKFKE